MRERERCAEGVYLAVQQPKGTTGLILWSAGNWLGTIRRQKVKLQHSSAAFVELTGKSCQLRHERNVPRVMVRGAEGSPEWGNDSSDLRERVGTERKALLTGLEMWTPYIFHFYHTSGHFFGSQSPSDCLPLTLKSRHFWRTGATFGASRLRMSDSEGTRWWVAGTWLPWWLADRGQSPGLWQLQLRLFTDTERRQHPWSCLIVVTLNGYCNLWKQ